MTSYRTTRESKKVLIISSSMWFLWLFVFCISEEIPCSLYQIFKYSFEWSNNFYSFDVVMFYDLSLIPFSNRFQAPPSRFPILLIRFYSVSNLLLVISSLLTPAKYVWVKFLNTPKSLFSDPGVLTSFLAVFEKKECFNHSRINGFGYALVKVIYND